ncbi:anti-repressor SinI family protein [Lentibacillus saliphilus]|nr:anti-repressor SinI family protein [Lentibacillus saliphilus]
MDLEWVDLIWQAAEQGMTKQQVRSFIRQKKRDLHNGERASKDYA